LDEPARGGGPGDFGRVVAFDHPDDPVHGFVHIGLERRRTPGHDHPHAGVLAAELANETAGLRVRLVGHRAGVDDHQLRVVHIAGLGAARLKLLAHPLGVVLVGLAAEGVVGDPHGPFPGEVSRG